MLRSMEGNQGGVLVKQDLCVLRAQPRQTRKLPESVTVSLILSSGMLESNLAARILLLNDKKVLLRSFKTAQKAKLTGIHRVKL